MVLRLVELVGMVLLAGAEPSLKPGGNANAVKVAQATPAPGAKPGTPGAPAPKPAAPEPATKGPTAAAGKPAAAAPALGQAERDLVTRMQAFYEKTADFRADFQQVYAYKTFKRKQTSSGTVTFKKPGLMRWEYLKPEPRTFVLAGDKIYAHDPEAKLLTRAAIDTSQLSASVTFLFGKGNLLDEFDISKVACSSCKGTLLELIPKKPDPRFRKVQLEVDPQSAQVISSTVVDPDGSENKITFLNLKTNVGVNEDHFKLAPPAGTQVVDYSQQQAPKP